MQISELRSRCPRTLARTPDCLLAQPRATGGGAGECAAAPLGHPRHQQHPFPAVTVNVQTVLGTTPAACCLTSFQPEYGLKHVFDKAGKKNLKIRLTGIF